MPISEMTDVELIRYTTTALDRLAVVTAERLALVRDVRDAARELRSRVHVEAAMRDLEQRARDEVQV